MAGVTRRSLDQPAVQDQAAADAGRDDHAEHVAHAPARSPPVLADGHGDRVVMHPHRDAREALQQPGAQREGPPGRDVERRHHAFRPFHRAAGAAAHPGQPGRAADLGAVQDAREQRVEGAPQLLGIHIARRGYLRPADQPATRVPPPRRRAWCRRCRSPAPDLTGSCPASQDADHVNMHIVSNSAAINHSNQPATVGSPRISGPIGPDSSRAPRERASVPDRQARDTA